MWGLVWASEGHPLVNTLSRNPQTRSLLQTIPGSDLNWLLLIGGGVAIITFLSFVVVPKLLDQTLGLMVFIGLLGVVGVTAILVPQLSDQSTLSLARDEGIPEQVQIYNLQPTEFIVSWKTRTPVTGAVVYGQNADNLDQVAVEVEPTNDRTEHLIRVYDLQPGTTYFLKIVSGGKEYLKDGNPMVVHLPR